MAHDSARSARRKARKKPDAHYLFWQRLGNSGFIALGVEVAFQHDPVCLDLQPVEYPKQTVSVVKFDHEAILQELPVVLRETIDESLLGFLEEQA